MSETKMTNEAKALLVTFIIMMILAVGSLLFIAKVLSLSADTVILLKEVAESREAYKNELFECNKRLWIHEDYLIFWPESIK